MSAASNAGSTRKSGWKKGQSGNPAGRPPDKEMRAAREACLPHVPLALETLVDICRNGKSEPARVAAAEKILERAWGKPPQSIELLDPNQMTDDQLRAKVQEIVAVHEASKTGT